MASLLAKCKTQPTGNSFVVGAAGLCLALGLTMEALVLGLKSKTALKSVFLP